MAYIFYGKHIVGNGLYNPGHPPQDQYLEAIMFIQLHMYR